MKYLRTYEQKDIEKWNKILHRATWRADKDNDEIPYDKNFINKELVKTALENGADPDSCETLSWAIRMDDIETVKLMVNNGANINMQDNDCKWTPIMSAVGSSENPINLETCIFLLDNGADPTIVNFQDINTMDLLSHTKMLDYSPAYPHTNDENKRKMDIISKHIIDIILEKTPEESIKYKKYLTIDQKIKFKPYLDSEKYNL